MEIKNVKPQIFIYDKEPAQKPTQYQFGDSAVEVTVYKDGTIVVFSKTQSENILWCNKNFTLNGNEVVIQD